MRTSQSIRNGDLHRIAPHHQFISTITLQKLRRFNILILVFRLAAFSFSFSASIFMVTNSRGSGSPAWHDYDAFRFVFVANAIVALYSLFEMGTSVWEISRGITLLPEGLQVWIDFGHDQVLAYLLISAEAAGTEVARRLKVTEVCGEESAGFFCVQSDIAIALGFAGFLFLGFSSLLSGFRVVSFLMNGTRFNL